MDGSWLYGAIGVLATLVGTIYFVQVIWPRIHSQSVRDSEVEERTQELLQKHAERRATKDADERRKAR